MQDKINEFLDLVRERNGNEPEFMQAVEEVAETVSPLYVSAALQSTFGCHSCLQCLSQPSYSLSFGRVASRRHLQPRG